MLDFFPETGHWYKGNLHSHTTVSDGNWTPKQAIQEYKEQGYSFLCISDHNVYTDYRTQFDQDNFITLPGVEAAAVLLDKNGKCLKVHHMNGILGTEKMQTGSLMYQHGDAVGPFVTETGTWEEEEEARKLALELKNHGMLVTYNHPVWSRISLETYHEIPEIDILEIYNYNTENESNTGYDVHDWDILLRRGRKILADATDDNHNGGLFRDAFGGFIFVKAACLRRENIIQAIQDGCYYSSSGPTIAKWGLEETNNTINVTCSPCERIIFITDGYVGAGTTVIAKGVKYPITQASYPLQGSESYIRVECRDFQGKTAWTNAYYLRGGQK